MLDDIIKQIDKKAVSLAPAMDDYDAGVIEGLRRARAIIAKQKEDEWNAIYKDTEYSEFRTQDGGGF